MLSKIFIKKYSGFSLIEVLLVLALVGIMAAIVAGNAGAFLQAGGYEPPVRVLKKAVLDAYYLQGREKKPLSSLISKKMRPLKLVTRVEMCWLLILFLKI